MDAKERFLRPGSTDYEWHIRGAASKMPRSPSEAANLVEKLADKLNLSHEAAAYLFSSAIEIVEITEEDIDDFEIFKSNKP